VNSTGFFAAKFLPWLVFWFVLRVVFGIGCTAGGPGADLGMAFVDDWVVSNEKSLYWLSNDIVGLVENLVI